MKEENLHYNDLLEEYEALLYHCLNRCYVKVNDANYDDYLQIARIALIKASQLSQVNPLSVIEEERYQFISFARKRLIWAIRDAQRKAIRIQDYEANIIEETQADSELVYSNPLDEQSILLGDTTCQWVIGTSLLKEIIQVLSEKEYQLLCLLLDEDLNQSQRAKRLGVSRKSFYRQLHLLREKLNQRFKFI